MRGGLKLLLAPDIPVELVSGRRLSATATPASVRADRGVQLNGATLSIPVVSFTLGRAVTVLLITRTPSGTTYPSTGNIVQFNGGSGVVPLLSNNSGTGIRWTPSYAAASAIVPGTFFNASEKKVLWGLSTAGAHSIVVDGAESTVDTSASYDALTVTSVDVLGLDAATVVSYLAVFDRYLDLADRREIERDPRILTRPDLVSVFYEVPEVVLATATATQSIPAFTQSGIAQAQPKATATQSVPDFAQSAIGQARALGTATQSVPPFTQSGTALALANATATQSVPAFSQSAIATAPAGAAATATQSVPPFTQSAIAAARAGAVATQSVPAFTQSGIAGARAAATATQSVPEFGQSASATQAMKTLESDPARYFRRPKGTASFESFSASWSRPVKTTMRVSLRIWYCVEIGTCTSVDAIVRPCRESVA